MRPADLAEMIRYWETHDDALALEMERVELEQSLLAFFCRAWREIDATPFRLNWHHEVICDALEGVTRGEIRNLLINQPPRTGKTILTSIVWPAWCWIQRDISPWSGPQVRFLCVSYGATLAEEIGLKMLRLVRGPWYRRLWGDRVRILDDQMSRADFANSAGGGRVSNSLHGALLGRGGDVQLIDDPQDPEGAESELERQATVRAFTEGLPTRVTDPNTAARVMVMQRLHQEDCSGVILDRADEFRGEHWTPIILPMRYDPRRPSPFDPRETEGELLWPEQWSDAIVTRREQELGPVAAAGQLQQAPVPRGGGIIMRDWWRLWPEDAEGDPDAEARFTYRCYTCRTERELPNCGAHAECDSCGGRAERRLKYPQMSFRVLSVDTAYGEREENSWCAATCWGIWHGKEEAPRTMLMEAWRGRPKLRGNAEEKGLVEIIFEIAKRREVDVVLIEKKTRAKDLYDEIARLMQRERFRLEYFEPQGRGDKTVRLNAVVPMFTNGLVWAPNKAWAETVITEVASQPRAKFSDLSDTTTQVLLWLRDADMLRLGDEHIAEIVRQRSRPLPRMSVVEEYETA